MNRLAFSNVGIEFSNVADSSVVNMSSRNIPNIFSLFSCYSNEDCPFFVSYISGLGGSSFLYIDRFLIKKLFYLWEICYATRCLSWKILWIFIHTEGILEFYFLFHGPKSDRKSLNEGTRGHSGGSANHTLINQINYQ